VRRVKRRNLNFEKLKYFYMNSYIKSPCSRILEMCQNGFDNFNMTICGIHVTTFCRERKRRGIGLRVSQNPVLLKCVETAQNLERRCCQFGDVTLYSRQNYTPNYSSRQNLMDTTTPPDYLLQLQNTPNTQHHSNPHAHAP